MISMRINEEADDNGGVGNVFTKKCRVVSGDLNLFEWGQWGGRMDLKLKVRHSFSLRPSILVLN